MVSQIKTWVDSRWFSLADLLIVTGCGAIWYFYPELGWKILLIALFPWAVRIAAGKAPFSRTIFDIPVLIFLLTALLGAQVAFDPQVSWAKFWLIVAGVLFFYALAGQPRENTWLVIQIMTGVGVAIAILFLLVYDWQTHPVRSEIANRLGLIWMKVRPTVHYPLKDEDIISNLLLVLTPFPIGMLVHARSKPGGSRWLLAFALGSIAFFMTGLCMAAIMEAVCVLLIGALFVGLWLLGRLIEKKGRKLLWRIFLIGTVITVFLGCFFFIRSPEKILLSLKELPVFSHYEDRLTVNINALQLAKDFPLTGGGLGAFPGLYSKYILVIPYLFISFGSNLFLQIAVEHGVFGSLAYGSILTGGMLILLYRLWQKSSSKEQLHLLYLTLAGYGVLLVVGMMDAILYNGLGIFFLFIIPGFAMFALDQPQDKEVSRYIPIILLGAGSLLFFFGLGNKLLAVYYANRGVVEMAKLDLKDWMYDGTSEPQPEESYSGAIQYFEKALKIDPLNHTANYWLGMLAVNWDKFLEGCSYLEKAYAVNPMNRGVVKNLGYCYVWLGEINSAVSYLEEIPEASVEMEWYSWWWGTQDRNDLSEYANLMVKKLATIQTKGNQ